MNKKTKLKLSETLDKALEAPKRKNLSQLDALLNEYDVTPEKPRIEMAEATRPKTTQPNTTQSKTIQAEISPTRNFTKVPNSITKLAIPEKLFKGLSKHTYDILYRQTRGAVTPVRKIQLTKGEIMKLTGLSFNTVQTHIKYLKDAGLVKVEMIIGKHEGSVYEILIPEEVTQPNPTQVDTRQHKTTSKTQPDTIQKLGSLGLGNTTENKEVTESLKPSLETNSNDDEAFRPFNEKLAAAVERITGKKPNARDAQNWATLADLLILQLDAAAQRTNNVSNVPAFLTEVCRRKFLNVSPAPKSKTKIDMVGKAESEPYEVMALDPEGRESALEQLREFAADDFLQDFRKWYTADDWNWLIENLKS